MNVRLFLAYKGTAFKGWQIQNMNGEVRLDRPTVAGALLASLRTLLNDESIELFGVSRTDAGVHADMYCANFVTANEKFPMERIPLAIAHLLPPDIVVTKADVVPDDFHARFSCKRKTYRYVFYTGPHAIPVLNDLAWYTGSYEPDFAKMEEACANITGEHDYSAFMASGNSSKTTIRTIFSCNIKEKTHDAGDAHKVYELTISGDGFLYNMVRIITGTVFYSGIGKIDPADIPSIIESKDRAKAGITAPPEGLYLHYIHY